MMRDSSSVPLHQLLAQRLPLLGVEVLYGLVGDANLFLVDAYRKAGGRYVGCTHEANAVLAAIGAAQATNGVGVATITHGPALTNVVTALTEAAKGGVPVVLLCGDTAPGDNQHLQKLNQREVVAASGALFIEMGDVDTAVDDMARAFRLARLRRMPVVLNMRIDLQWREGQPASVPMESQTQKLAAASGDLMEEAVGMLASARRPLILAGRGAIDRQARDAIIRLAQRIEAPLATTLKAQGLFAGVPFDMGICGGLSHPLAGDRIAAADCILAFGASLSKHTTELGAYTRGKRVIQVLPDAEETPRLDRPTIRLIGDIAATADHMTALLDEAEVPGSGATDADLAGGLQTEASLRAAEPPFAPTAPGTVDFAPALHRLNRAIPEQRVLVADLGRFVTTAWRQLPVTRPEDLVYTSHFGGIGCGIGQAVGAAAAIHDRPTVLIAGDGGFLLSGLSELSTVRRHRLDLIMIICNDGSYGAEHVQFTNRQMDTGLSMIEPPDFAAVAQAMAIEAVKVESPCDLEAACLALGRRQGPLLIDLHLDPTKIEM